MAVASSSHLAQIQNILTQCDIIQYFDLIVSGEQFERSKPDPTIYRHTLEKLGAQAKNAVAIEDSFFGIQAAKALAFPSLPTKKNACTSTNPTPIIAEKT